jgi:hypothetical protein
LRGQVWIALWFPPLLLSNDAGIKTCEELLCSANSLNAHLHFVEIPGTSIIGWTKALGWVATAVMAVAVAAMLATS